MNLVTEKITIYAREDKRCLCCKKIIPAEDPIVGAMIKTEFYTTFHYLCSNLCYEQYLCDIQVSEVFIEAQLRHQGLIK